MLCWEVTEKRRGDTTSPQNAAADFAVSRALEVVFRAHAVPTFCTAGACARGNGRFESFQRAWAGGVLRTVPATTQPDIWHSISQLLHPGGLFGLLAGYQTCPRSLNERVFVSATHISVSTVILVRGKNQIKLVNLVYHICALKLLLVNLF
jgi:hypothetical protein